MRRHVMWQRRSKQHSITAQAGLSLFHTMTPKHHAVLAFVIEQCAVPCDSGGMGAGVDCGWGMNCIPYAAGAVVLPTMPPPADWLPALLPPLLLLLLSMYLIKSAAQPIQSELALWEVTASGGNCCHSLLVIE